MFNYSPQALWHTMTYQHDKWATTPPKEKDQILSLEKHSWWLDNAGHGDDTTPQVCNECVK